MKSRLLHASWIAATFAVVPLPAQTTHANGESTSTTLTIAGTLVTQGSYAGALSLFAGNTLSLGTPNIRPEGQSLSRTTYADLFSAVGTTYGSQSGSTFSVPNLAGLRVVGADGNLGATTGSTIALNYAVATSGTFPGTGLSSNGEVGSLSSPYLAQIMATTSTTLPSGWAWANGGLLNISENESLFSLLGTGFGGDGQTTFALPDLRGRSPIGNTSTNFVGTTTSSTVAITLAMALQGIYPSGSPSGDTYQYIGEVYMFAFSDLALPSYLSEANGQLLAIGSNTALFSLTGTYYGGNGQTSFAVPNFQDRTFILAGTAAAIPEASTSALAAALIALGVVGLRRRRAIPRRHGDQPGVDEPEGNSS